MTTHECVHLVTSSYYWLRNKDGNHAIRLAIAETKTATEVLLLFFLCFAHDIRLDRQGQNNTSFGG